MAPQPVIRSRQMEKAINGIPTHVVCTEFSNYIFIVLTQYGKIGTLVSITPDTRSGDISVPMFTTRVLLGKDEVWFQYVFVGLSIWHIKSSVYFTMNFFSLFQPLTHVYAKNVTTFVSQESGNRPVLLGLSLKDNSAATMKTVKDMIKGCQVW